MREEREGLQMKREGGVRPQEGEGEGDGETQLLSAGPEGSLYCARRKRRQEEHCEREGLRWKEERRRRESEGQRECCETAQA